MRVRPAVAAAGSGLALGLGSSVLLQQFAVWPLTVWTLVVLPAAVAALAGLMAVLLSRR